MNDRKLTILLEPTGEGGTLKERLARAMSETAGTVTLQVVAVVVEMTPVRPDVPAPTAWRVGLKKIGRKCGLRAKWPTPPPRPKRKTTSKRRLKA